MKNYFRGSLLTFSMVAILTACGSEESNKDAAASDEGHDEFPTENITLTVPYDTGGTSDRIARGITKTLSDEIGSAVTVENVLGGSGIVGTTGYLNQKDSDGHHLLFLSHPHFEGSVIRSGEFSYDDFDMVGIVHDSPIALWVNADAGFETAEEFITELQNNPGKYRYGGLAGSYSDVTAKIFNDRFAIDAAGVPYDGGGELRTSVLSGETDYIMTDIEGTIAGAGEDLIPLLTFSGERYHLTEDVPTMNEVLEEMGQEPDFPAQSNMKSIMIHKDVKENHPERYDSIINAFDKAMTDEDLLSEFETQGIFLGWIPGDEGLEIAQEAASSIEENRELFE
ncbi:tripartite tricarboxylate transporter substrate binding protein [Evansella sp. LMS18]|jgi:tripartite-type tricarboxylate transporter receptor subunit TctC|uniref:Bug family tripartite tricarboxylate transporter substrate binding protein n=1 Tax=Evansella sp. LMS18 TaxID=2924033 RepID=UPI0020D00D9E|nr:tripartite tricarboxylate transporter substrate binding protein [Evansella sp. LMS18]UTR12051.1 tripartite tricarboxylate transporter substrate binding protein [Evansella sp. LMS18]